MAEIAPRLAEIDAKIVGPYIVDQNGNVLVSPTDWASIEIQSGVLEDAMDRTRNWPAVRFVEYNVVGRLAAVGVGEAPVTVSASLPLARGPAARGDRTVQVAASDMIVVEYLQPGKDLLIRSVSVP